MTSAETAVWTADPYHPLPVLRDNNYFATISRNVQGYWWDVDDNYGDGELFGTGLCSTEQDARTAAEKAIREHLDSVIAGAKAVQDTFVTLHRTLVDDARASQTVDTDEEQRAADMWLSGYSEGVEHALETIATGGEKAKAFLTALHNHQGGEAA